MTPLPQAASSRTCRSKPMVAATSALALVQTREREKAAAPNFAPGQPFVWFYGRIVYADERTAPKPSRFVAFCLRWRDRAWYEWLKQPRLSSAERPAIPDRRAMRGSRSAVRAMCHDEMDVIYGFPFDAEPFGDEILLNPTVCRPHWPPHYQKDAEQAELYTGSLREMLCAERSAQLREIGEVAGRMAECARAALDDV